MFNKLSVSNTMFEFNLHRAKDVKLMLKLVLKNWVMVDFPHVAAQLGHDLFNGEGWEAYDRGEKNPPQPEN